MRKLRKNKRCTLDVWAHQGSGQSSCETCTSLLSLSKALPSELLNPQLLTCTHLTNGSCEKMRCQGEGAAGVELSRGHREAELCPFLNIYFHPKPLWVWGHGGPFWYLSAWMALWASSVEISAGKRTFQKVGCIYFLLPCRLLFLAEPDLSQTETEEMVLSKSTSSLIMPDCYKWEITVASANSGFWNVLMIPSCYTYLVVALYLKIVNTWLFSSKDFGSPGLVGYLSFLLFHTQK